MFPVVPVLQAGAMTTAPHESPDTDTTTADEAALPPPVDERLHRGGDGRMLAGVAAGLADYFDVDPTLVRIGFVALAFLGGLAIPLYLAGWLLIPEEGADSSVAEELLHHERIR
jgi:phage shock protein PspC (stress-responsive transcriptional regulator)